MSLHRKSLYLIILTTMLAIVVIMLEMSDTETVPPNSLDCNNSTYGGNCKTDDLTRRAAAKETCTKRVPQALIAGVQKGGTGTLRYFLSFHPQVVTCAEETDYFDFHSDKPISWYRDLMPCSYSHQITIEKSVSYFYRKYTAKRVKDMVPDMKVIFIMKDPIVRAESQYAMHYYKYNAKDFEGAVTKTNSDKRTVIDESVNMIRFSDYATQVKPWLQHFNRNQLLFVDGHNFIENPSEELIKIEKFLGIETYFTPDRFWFNETKGMYCLDISGVEDQCMSPKKGRTHPSYASKVKKLLQKFFKPLNEEFFNLINKRFDWGY